MKAVILAAGYATRLYPLTIDKPKPLLPVGGRPMIDWIVDKINEVPEIDGITVVTNDKFYETFKQWAEGKENITVLNDGTTSNENRLGMLGDIAFALKQIKDDAVLVIGGDNLFKFDLNPLVNLSKEKNAPAVPAIELNDINEARKMGIFCIDDNKKIIDFEEKPQNPKSMLASACCYMLNSEAIKVITEFKGSGQYHLITLLMENMDVYVQQYKEEWIDIGSHEQYKHVNELYKK
ncbi:nucleotidyltransferase family protein [Candidatus Woesearchaeota archaeon]|nr:nucleotidyltransferase family protein [Candidatus Woesearchaeota archaeon]